jgi:hypothetical protein
MQYWRMVIGLVAVSVLAAAGWAAAEPLHTYLTYSDDPTTSIDINLFIKDKVPGVAVYFDTVSRTGDKGQYAHHVMAPYHQTVLEILDGRALYVADLKDLTPGATYYFVAGEEKYGYTKERSFRTLAGGAPLGAMSLADPLTAVRQHIRYLFDGVGWRPLSCEWDYDETARRIRLTLFAETL